jgi:hypothetical protein
MAHNHLDKHQVYLPFGGPLSRYDDDGSFRVWHKFGRNTAVGTTEEDIWNGGAAKETLPTTGTTMWIACDDNVNGVGQVINVFGLDENWDYQSVNVTLNGNTPVQIGDANGWTRIMRARQVSSEPDPVGDVWIGDDDTDFVLGVPATASTVHGHIDYTDSSQQTEKCMITVPRGHEAAIFGFHGTLAKAGGGVARSVEVYIEVQELAEGATLANPSWAPWRRIDQHSMKSDGNVESGDRYVFPLGPFGQLTNIHVRGEATTESEVIADMDVVTYQVT